MKPRRPSSLREWVAVAFGAIGIGLLPWAVWLSASLPPQHHSAHWDVAWSGFDVGLAICFVGTAVSAYRRSPWVAAFAAATGTLLLTDAWFDVILESHGNEKSTAVFEAVVFEVPVAVLCFWIAYRTERFLAKVVEQALHLAPARERPTERDLVGVLEVTADREAAREPRDADASA
jgi:cbb3-type cytochrome oxidase subunit 3